MSTIKPIVAGLALVAGIVVLSAQGPIPPSAQWPPMAAPQSPTQTGVLASGVAVPAQLKLKDGSAAAPSLTFASDTDTGLHHGTSANEILLTSSGTDGLYLGAQFLQMPSGQLFGWTSSTASGAQDVVLARNAAGVLQVTSNLLLGTASSTAAQYRSVQALTPVCYVNCGTAPSVVGTDSDMIVTMGASGVPASLWQVGFRGAWAANPVCIGQMALGTMANTKLPIVIVTTTGGLTVTTNGASPGTSDVYAITCHGRQ